MSALKKQSLCLHTRTMEIEGETRFHYSKSSFNSETRADQNQNCYLLSLLQYNSIGFISLFKNLLLPDSPEGF